MKIFNVLLILTFISIALVEIDAGESKNASVKDVSGVTPKEDTRNSLTSSTPQPQRKQKKYKENKRMWLKTFNNISRNTVKDTSKQFEKVVNITYKNTLNVTNEVFDIFNSLRGNELPVREIVFRMPTLLTQLTQDQISDTLKAINEYIGKVTTYAQYSINDAWDFGRIFRFTDRESDEDENRLSNVFTGFRGVIRNVLDNFLETFAGRSDDDDDD